MIAFLKCPCRLQPPQSLSNLFVNILIENLLGTSFLNHQKFGNTNTIQDILKRSINNSEMP